MRLLLIGANGQVGHALQHSLAALGEVIATTRSGRLPGGNAPCEVADLDRPDDLYVLLARTAPDVVVNAAAYTGVDKAESDREAAFRINAEAVGVLAATCAARDALLVHYSTDYVFPGDDPRPRREDDPTGPLNVYGASKLAGEEAIRASGCRHLLFRTSWVYGARGHNFLRTMLHLAGERDEVRVVADQIGAPTPAEWIAQVTARTIAHGQERSGTWHLAAAGETSWYGFAQAIFDQALRAGLIDKRPTLVAARTSEYPTPAHRPAYSRLDTAKLTCDFDIAPTDWRQGLSEVIADLTNTRNPPL